MSTWIARMPPTGVTLAFLQHAQQPGLQRQRHVADLVQEQGAAMRLLHLADRALARARR